MSRPPAALEPGPARKSEAARRVSTSDGLHARVRAYIHAWSEGRSPDEDIDALFLDVARFQAEFNPAVARLCAHRGREPAEWASRLDVPAVPTDAFKLTRVAAFPPEETRRTFRTSGTTVGSRGAHPFRTLETYRQGALAFARVRLIGVETAPHRVFVVGPSPREADDSSLAYMLGAFADELPCGGPALSERETYFVVDGAVQTEEFARVIQGLGRDPRAPVLVAGTSFAFVHLLDGLGARSLPLPLHSRVMTTGGYKGKSREVDPAELREALGRTFHVPATSVIGEYGMTELSSQFYEDPEIRAYVEPPWARVVPVDPETLQPVPFGVEGVARIEDGANVDSAVAVLTQDRVRRVPGGFELLGRMPGAPPRGCALAMDMLLRGGDG